LLLPSRRNHLDALKIPQILPPLSESSASLPDASSSSSSTTFLLFLAAFGDSSSAFRLLSATGEASFIGEADLLLVGEAALTGDAGALTGEAEAFTGEAGAFTGEAGALAGEAGAFGDAAALAGALIGDVALEGEAALTGDAGALFAGEAGLSVTIFPGDWGLLATGLVAFVASGDLAIGDVIYRCCED
jgi:hypothetical protein